MQAYLKRNILKQYKASTILDINKFESFIIYVYNLFDNAKYAINTLIGIFGYNYKSKNIHHFTQDNRLVLSELKQKNSFHLRALDGMMLI